MGQPRDHLPSSSYSQRDKGKASDVQLGPIPTPPLDISLDSEDKPEIGGHTWQGFKFADRDVTPSMSSLPTAIPRSSLNPSTFTHSPNNAWAQSEDSFSTVHQPRTSLDYSRDPRTPLDFSLARDESPHSQLSTTSNPDVYSQFPPLSEDRERPFSTPTVPTP
ncbi:hypothetical protein DID88_004396 [Monilinia fructigena]|uniref:Uncharacterized protein n=1 Tax=Monilinia fructigena TaxID=38457 RepID=A0A395ISN2_9HELO|nr:hypothetical protein DID88_004396 [Monilinia fructigena]